MFENSQHGDDIEVIIFEGEPLFPVQIKGLELHLLIEHGLWNVLLQSDLLIERCRHQEIWIAAAPDIQQPSRTQPGRYKFVGHSGAPDGQMPFK
jgi:hypothetical protein